MLQEIERLSSLDEETEGAKTGGSEIDYNQTFHRFGQGHVVKGIIVSISQKDVIVDIGFKSEGVIPAHEFD